MKRPLLKWLAAMAVAGVFAPPAHAVLQRVGPVDGTHGFPVWYQDANGLALEFCVPTTQADLNAGLCAILPGTPPAGLSTLPEVFPDNFSLEHFYYRLSSSVITAGLDKKTRVPVSGAGRFVFDNGVEATFNTSTPTAGQQITFNRWRVRVDNLACTGPYTFYTPSRAPKTIQGTAGGRIADTEDIGIGAGFEGALAGAVGPFALRSATPGGAASAFVTGMDGKQYLSAADLGAITGSVEKNLFQGSTLGYVPQEVRAMSTNNYVMMVGPGVVSGNCGATEAVSVLRDFQVIGRVNTAPIASRTFIDRATYRAVDSNGDGIPDRFQIGAWANSVQEVGRPEPVLALSLNKGDPADTANSTPELAMTKLSVTQAAPVPGTVATPKFIYFNGVLQPVVAGRVSPAFTHARVRTTTDNPASMQNIPLADELRVTAANYNASARTLTVTADSGAQLVAASPVNQSAAGAACSDPCLVLDAYGLPEADALGAPIDYKMKIATGAKFALATVTIPNVTTPPGFVTVRSSGGGWDRHQVMYLGAAAGTAVLQPDSVSTQMNLKVPVDVLANDVGVAAAPNLQICTAGPTGGTCGIPSATATCTAGVASTSCTVNGGRLLINGNVVTYTPPANRGGITDTFWYQAATVLGTTQRQLVTVNIGLLNGLPDARDDLGNTGVATKPLTIDVLANDFAPAGVDLATLRFVPGGEPTDPAGAKAVGSASFVGGKLVFTPPYAPAPAGGLSGWTMIYTFTDRAGVTADQGVVTVNVIGSEVITPRAVWKAGKAPALGTISVNGTVNISQGQTLSLYSTTSGVTTKCNAPTTTTAPADSFLGTTGVVGGAFDFGAIPLAVKPVSVWVYSPAFGGCTQIPVQ